MEVDGVSVAGVKIELHGGLEEGWPQWPRTSPSPCPTTRDYSSSASPSSKFEALKENGEMKWCTP